MKWFRGYKVAAYKGFLETLGLPGLFGESGIPLDVMKKKEKRKEGQPCVCVKQREHCLSQIIIA